MLSPKLEITADGSSTLYLPEMEEHYHSVNGAVQESQHVYIAAGLQHFLAQNTTSAALPIHLLELGFGTGLNAFLAALHVEEKQIPLIYTSLEKFPLPEEITSQLNYGEISAVENPGLFQSIHSADWELPVCLTSFFSLHKVRTDFNHYSFPGKYDVVFYDAFAPDKQDEVWNQALFDKLFSSMNTGGVLTTYCAKGAIRRMMQQAGFSVERIPGPPGKREMLRATKP